jgi:hypothetical protein
VTLEAQIHLKRQPSSSALANMARIGGARPFSPARQVYKYKSQERKLTGVIVAIPFFLVTSYLLYKRIFLGDERKVLQRKAPEAA